MKTLTPRFGMLAATLLMVALPAATPASALAPPAEPDANFCNGLVDFDCLHGHCANGPCTELRYVYCTHYTNAPVVPQNTHWAGNCHHL